MKLKKQKFSTINQLSLVFLSLFFSNNVYAGCNLKLNETTPTSNFTFNNDGTVTHITTNLVWKLCPEGQVWSQTAGCTGEVERIRWSDALSLVSTHNDAGGFAGHTDWRLPNIKELGSIVERSCVGPAVNKKIFTSLDDYFWSSTPDINNAGNTSFDVWLVNFYEGTIEALPNYSGSYLSSYEAARVILVRGSQ